MPAQLTHAQFTEKFLALGKPLKILGTYTRHCDKIATQCLECNGVFSSTANKLLHPGRGCKPCGYKRAADNSRRSHESFEEEVKSKNPTVQLLSKYIGSDDRISCLCKKCGHQWDAIAYNLITGYSCIKCSYKKRGEEQQKDHDLFVNELMEVNPNIEILTEYTRLKGRVDCRCHICKHEWSSLPGNLLRSKGCPECATIIRGLKTRKSHDEYIAQVNAFNPHLKIHGEYETGYALLVGECLKCGHKREQLATSFLKAKCPGCNYLGFKGSEEYDFYLIEMHGDGNVFYGFGITNNKRRRMVSHSKNLGDAGYSIENTYYWHFSTGWEARELENDIKDSIKCDGHIDVEGFKTEAALPKDLPALLSIIDSYKKRYKVA